MTYRSSPCQSLCLMNEQACGPLMKGAVKEGLIDMCITYDRPRLRGVQDAMKIGLLNAPDGVLQEGRILPCIRAPWTG